MQAFFPVPIMEADGDGLAVSAVLETDDEGDVDEPTVSVGFAAQAAAATAITAVTATRDRDFFTRASERATRGGRPQVRMVSAEGVRAVGDCTIGGDSVSYNRACNRFVLFTRP